MDQAAYAAGLHTRTHSRSTPVLPQAFTLMDSSDDMIADDGRGSARTRLTTDSGRRQYQADGAAGAHTRTHSNSSPGPGVQLSSFVSSDDTTVAGSQGTVRNRPGGGHTYSDGNMYSDSRGHSSESSRGQTWHDFLRESGGDAAEGPYPPFLDQHRRRASRLSHVESSTPRALHLTTPPAPSDRKRRSTAPDPHPTAQPGHNRSHGSAAFTRPPLPLPRPSRQRGHGYSASISVLPSSNQNLYATTRHPPLPPLPPQSQHSQQASRRFSSYHQRSDYFQTTSSQDNDIMLPSWQPDAEVTQCPVCSNTFTFFTRKHHCRKCGRVVCARCSPHRITIPRQFIVRLPVDDLDAGSPRGISSTGDSDFDAVPDSYNPHPLNPALGGGEEVRVCNPCVPDPNFSPPPRRPEPPLIRSQPQQNPGWQRPHDIAANGRNAYTVGRNGHPFPQQSSSIASTRSSAPRVPSPGGTVFPTYEEDESVGRLPPPRVLTEDEICPVCRQELPPVPAGVDVSTAREQHIAACIDLRLGGSPAANTASASTSGPQSIMSYQKLAYKATEKDCQGDECIMCFEEFVEGEELARLACLCKFHNACIDQWWAVKGPGSCPTHQLQL